MFLKSCIYLIAVILSLFSLIILICSIKNKNKNICKCIIVINIIYIIYLFLDLMIIPSVLYVEIGLEILFLYLFAFIAVILYIVSIIICFIKNKKYSNNYDNKKKIKCITLLLLIIPILFFSLVLLRQNYLIKNSNIILIYYSRGNGGFGDGETFAYAINDNYCEQFDLGIDFHGYKVEKFLPENSSQINNNQNISNYNITLNTNGILVYKNNKCIHEKQHKSHYFNIELEKKFYINHN